jgi:hypothetical protein
MSVACAIAYQPGSRRTRLCFQIVPDSYNEQKLVEFLKRLKTHFRGQRIVLLWDGLPSHRSRIMTAYLAGQRSWLEVVQLPGYAPELNPVEGLWANIKGQELANRCVDDLGQMVGGVYDGFRRIRRQRALLRSFLEHTGLSLP